MYLSAFANHSVMRTSEVLSHDVDAVQHYCRWCCSDLHDHGVNVLMERRGKLVPQCICCNVASAHRATALQLGAWMAFKGVSHEIN